MTNDDGVVAAGLRALGEELSARFERVVVVAPDEEHSECGHCVTTKKPLVVTEHERDIFSVNGTPADCVRIGLQLLANEVDWVISGINHGGNLGADIWMSGTVAAAREAYLRGRPAIAVSQVRRREIPEDWPQAARFAVAAIEQVLLWHEADPELWNINLPAIESRKSETPTMVKCPLDSNPLPLSFLKTKEGYYYRGDYHSRPRSTNTDVDICFQGEISISLLNQAPC